MLGDTHCIIHMFQYYECNFQFQTMTKKKQIFTYGTIFINFFKALLKIIYDTIYVWVNFGKERSPWVKYIYLQTTYLIVYLQRGHPFAPAICRYGQPRPCIYSVFFPWHPSKHLDLGM